MDLALARLAQQLQAEIQPLVRQSDQGLDEPLGPLVEFPAMVPEDDRRAAVGPRTTDARRRRGAVRKPPPETTGSTEVFASSRGLTFLRAMSGIRPR